jgi:hypothetical protein
MLNTVKRWDAWCVAWTLWDIAWGVVDLVRGLIPGVIFFTVFAVLMIFVWYKLRPGIAKREQAEKERLARRAEWLEEVCKRDY